MAPLDFVKVLILVFYRIGLVGLKAQRGELELWATQDARSVGVSELDGSTSVSVHPFAWKALHISHRDE